MVIHRAAKIGFFIRRPRDFFLFELLARELNAEFIIIPPIAMNIFAQGKRLIKTLDAEPMERFMASRDMPWRKYEGNILDNEINEIENFFSPYDALLDSQKSLFLMHPALNGKKRILYFYDDAIPGYWPTISFSNIDMVLSTGKYFNDLLRPFINTVQIGDLYLDFPQPYSKNELPQNLDENKKTILFAPSEDVFYSPAGFSGEINALTDEYNVIVQLSQISATSERNKNLFALNKEIILLDESFDIRKLNPFINIVLSDNSAAVMEWLSDGKPCIVLDAWSNEFNILNCVPDATRKNLSFDAGLFAAFSPAELRNVIDKALDASIPADNKFALNFFEIGTEPAYKRAAAAMAGFLASPSTLPSPKSVLAFHPGDHALQNFVLQHRLKNIFMPISNIFREPMLFKKIQKIIKTFF